MAKREWLTFRRNYLKDKQTWEGRYICSKCGLHVSNIEVDHIIKRSIAPHLIYEKSNLRLLCPMCHLSVNDDYKKPA